jgi:hypothetical protein
MAQYYYDISGDYPFLDEEGAEHLNDKAAWRDAVRLVRDVEEHLSPDGEWHLTVREGSRIVYSIEVTSRMHA